MGVQLAGDGIPVLSRGRPATSIQEGAENRDDRRFRLGREFRSWPAARPRRTERTGRPVSHGMRMPREMPGGCRTAAAVRPVGEKHESARSPQRAELVGRGADLGRGRPSGGACLLGRRATQILMPAKPPSRVEASSRCSRRREIGRPFSAGCAPASAVSGNVGPVDEAAEVTVVGVAVSPGDVAADHAALGVVVGVVRAVEGEVAQAGELRLDAVQPAGVERDVGQLDVVGGGPVADAVVGLGGQVRAEVVKTNARRTWGG
jgi:hypothetical protein